MPDQQRLSKFSLRQGRRLPTSSWTVVRGKWLSEQRSRSRRSRSLSIPTCTRLIWSTRGSSS
jgi:hypothetical protein